MANTTIAVSTSLDVIDRYRELIDILPGNAISSSSFIINNGYGLLDIENSILESIAQEDGSIETKFRKLTKEELKPYLLISINADYESSITALTSGVPNSEVATWPDQKAEIKAWTLDNSVSTPLIDSICLTRECDKEYLVSKILAKNEYYSIEVGKLTGIRQRLEKEILGE